MKDKYKQCLCSQWHDAQCVPMLGEIMPDRVFAELTILKKRTPWLDLVKCKHCGRHWYIATDTVVDDFHVLLLAKHQVDAILREDTWPTNFDGWDHVWPDQGWLDACGYTSIEDWREQEKV